MRGPNWRRAFSYRLRQSLRFPFEVGFSTLIGGNGGPTSQVLRSWRLMQCILSSCCCFCVSRRSRSFLSLGEADSNQRYLNEIVLAKGSGWIMRSLLLGLILLSQWGMLWAAPGDW